MLLMYWAWKLVVMLVGTITFFECRRRHSSTLVFLKRCRKYLTSSDFIAIFWTFIRPRMEYNSHVWVGASRSILKFLDRVQKRAKVLINDNRVSNSTDSLEHRYNVACVSLFIGKCFHEIKGLVPDNHIFLHSTCTSCRAHPFVVDCAVNRAMHCRENSFFPALHSYGMIFLQKFFPSVTISISLNQMSTNPAPPFHIPITYFP